MAFFTAMAIGATAGALLKGYQKGQQISRQRNLLKNQMAEVDRQRKTAKFNYYSQAQQAQIFGDYEEARIRRIQTFKTSQKMASMGGRGASLGSGTPYNIVLSQKAENETNVNLHKYKITTQTNNIRNKGDSVYADLSARHKALDEQESYLHRRTNEMVGMSMLTGGLQGAMQGASIYGAGASAGVWGAGATTTASMSVAPQSLGGTQGMVRGASNIYT